MTEYFSEGREAWAFLYGKSFMGIFIQKEEFGLNNIVKAGKNQGLEFFNWLLKKSNFTTLWE